MHDTGHTGREGEGVGPRAGHGCPWVAIRTKEEGGSFVARTELGGASGQPLDVAGAQLSRRRFLTLGAGFGAAAAGGALLAACGSSTSSGAARSSSAGKAARVSYSGQIPVVDDKILFTLAAYDLALSKGYFQKYGLNLSTVTSSSGAEIVREALTNLHFGIPASTDAMAAYATAPSQLRIIAGLYDTAALEYIVLPNSPIRSVADLKGKKIGCSTPTALSTYFATLAVKKAGLVPGQDVTIAYIGAPPAVYAALQHGLVDCCWSIPPLSTGEIAAGSARLLFKASQYAPNWFDNCIIADAAFVKSNPEITRNFLSAIGEATQFIRANPSQAGSEWAALAGQPAAATVTAFTENRDNFSLSFKGSYITAAAQADAVTGVAHGIAKATAIADGSYLPSPFTYSA